MLQPIHSQPRNLLSLTEAQSRAQEAAFFSVPLRLHRIVDDGAPDVIANGPCPVGLSSYRWFTRTPAVLVGLPLGPASTLRTMDTMVAILRSIFAVLLCGALRMGLPAGEEFFALAGELTPAALGGARVVSVRLDWPAARSGIQRGDRLLAVDGVRVYGVREFVYLLGRRPAGRYGVDLAVAGSDGLRGVTIAAALRREMLGLRLDDPEVPLAKALAARGLQLDEVAGACLNVLPLRYRLGLYDALPVDPATPVPGWMRRLVERYLALCREDYEAAGSGPAPAVPRPRLAALAAFHVRFAQSMLSDPGAVSPRACGVDPEFFAFCLPWPHVPKPPLGPAFADPSPLRRHLAESRRDGRDLSAPAREFCRSLLETSDRLAILLGLVQASLIAPEAYGMRLAGLSDLRLAEQLDPLISRLDRRLAAEPAVLDEAVLRAARFIAAIAAGDGPGMDRQFGRLRRISPYLAWQLWRLAPLVARRFLLQPRHLLDDFALRCRPEDLQPPPLLADVLSVWARTIRDLRPLLRDGNWSLIDGIPRQLRRRSELVVEAVTPSATRRKLVEGNGKVLARAWHQYGWVRSTDPLLLDPEESDLAAERLEALRGRHLSTQVFEVVAACRSCAGNHEAALRWLDYRRWLERGEVDDEARTRRWRRSLARGRHFVVDASLDLQTVHKDNILSRWHRNDDHRVGPYRRWYPSGRTREEGDYYRDKPFGLWRYYRKDGGLEREGRYWQGVRFGTWTDYYPSGRKRKQGVYSGAQPDEQIGEWRSWHPDGSLASSGFYYRGRRQGIWETHHDNGRLASRTEYERGRVVGMQLLWDRSGEPLDPTLPEDWGYDGF